MDIEGAAELDQALDALLTGLSPGERKKLSRHVARTLRKLNAARIQAQTEPDGGAFAPRRPDTYRPSFKHSLRDRRKLRRQMTNRKLFAKLRTTGHLRAKWTADEASAGFANPTTARIAQVHHFGLRDRVYRKGSLTADYPRRELLGLPEADRQEVLDQVLRHLSQN